MGAPVPDEMPGVDQQGSRDRPRGQQLSHADAAEAEGVEAAGGLLVPRGKADNFSLSMGL
jgi:hypothetical protein